MTLHFCCCFSLHFSGFLPPRLKNIVTTSSVIKIASHCLALLLHIGDLKVDLTLLHRDLSITETKSVSHTANQIFLFFYLLVIVMYNSHRLNRNVIYLHHSTVEFSVLTDFNFLYWSSCSCEGNRRFLLMLSF